MLNTKNLGIDKFERQLDSLLDGDLNEFESLKFDEKLNEIDNNPINKMDSIINTLENDKFDDTAYFQVNDLPSVLNVNEEKIPYTKSITNDKIPHNMLKIINLVISLAESLIKADIIFGNEDNELFLYDKKTGTFNHLPLEGELSLLSLVLNMNNIPFNNLVLNSSILRSLKKLLIHHEGFSIPLNPPSERFVNLKNGVLDLETLNLETHSPDFFFKYYIDADYIHNQPLSEISYKFFHHLTKDGTSLTSLMQLMGLMLSNIRTWQLGGLLIGPPACGKSVFAKFITKLFQSNTVYSANIDTFTRNTELHFLNQSHITICPDLEAGIIPKKATAIIKQLIGGDQMSIRRLYHDSEEIIPHTFLLFLSNTIPIIEDAPEAFERRFLPIYTGDTLPMEERSPDILDDLLRDRDAIVSLSLYHLHLIITHQTDIIQDKITFSHNEININSTLMHWFSTFYEYCPGNVIPISSVYEDFLDANHNLDLSLSGFSMRLKKLFPNCKSEQKVKNQRIIKNYTRKHINY